MSINFKKYIFPCLAILLILAAVVYILFFYKNTKQDTTYTLKAYKNSVALFENEKPIKVYDGIVLNTLPEQDIQFFCKGISVATQAQAEIILEDYE